MVNIKYEIKYVQYTQHPIEPYMLEVKAQGKGMTPRCTKGYKS